MDKTKAETMIRFLAFRFKCPKPRLTIGNRREGGRYYPGRRPRVHLPRCNDIAALVHEFAHHLHSYRNSSQMRVRYRQTRNLQEAHDESFYFTLRHVVAALGCNYPWSWEYRQIQRWARRDGLLV